jgi:succinoglycan biosynthesis transport protein ExoP
MNAPNLYLTRPGPARPQGPNIGRLVNLLVTRLHYIVALSVLGMMAAHDIQLRLPVRFTSSVSVMLDPRRPGSFGAASEFANLYVDSAKIASVEAILKSSSLLERVVDEERLADDPGFGAAPPSALRRWLEELPFLHLPPAGIAGPEVRRAIALAALTKAVQVKREGLTYVIVVGVSAPNPAQAKRLAQAVANAYLDDQVQTKMAATARDHAWLTARLRELDSQLLRDQQAVEAVRLKYGLAQTDRTPGSTIALQAVTDVNGELLRADSEVASLRARYQQAERILLTGGDLQASAEMLASPVIQDLRKQEVDLRRQLANMSSRYTKQHPDVMQAEQDLRAIQAQIAAEAARVVKNLHNQYDAAVARRDDIATHLQRMVHNDTGGPTGDGRVLLEQAERIVASTRTLYDAMLAKLREVEEQQTRSDPEGRIISPAAIPDAPSFPKPMIFLGLGAASGTVLGALLALLIPKRERGFEDVAAAEKALALPALGVLPRLERRMTRRPGPSGIISHIQIDPLSQYSECLRALRVALLAACGPGACVVQITSARAGEGKSTIAASLAVSAALAGLQTALVDADIRHASINAMFGLGHRAAEPDEENGESMVHRCPDMPLSIIDAGSATGQRPDAIASRQFAELIRSVARVHDVVIVDSPPVLSVSDPLVLARLADATLLVIEARATPKAMIDRAVRLLEGAGAPIVGLVLNKAKVSKHAEYGALFGPYGHESARPKRLTAQ